MDSAKGDAQNGDRTPPPTLPVKQVEPGLQLELKLRKGEDEGFHSVGGIVHGLCFVIKL